jgi:hypothetical protein
MATDAYIMEWIECPMPHHTTKEAAEQRMAGILKDFDDSFNPNPKEEKASHTRKENSPVKAAQIKILQRPSTVQTKKGGR